MDQVADLRRMNTNECTECRDRPRYYHKHTVSKEVAQKHFSIRPPAGKPEPL